MGQSIFLSHAHADRDITRQIIHELVDRGHRCWLDEAEINPGESIIAKIENGIDGVDYLVPLGLLTINPFQSNQSPY